MSLSSAVHAISFLSLAIALPPVLYKSADPIERKRIQARDSFGPEAENTPIMAAA